MTAQSARGYSRPRHPTAPPIGGVPIFPKLDSVRKILRSSILRRCLWRSKLRPVSCGGLQHCPSCGRFVDRLGHAGGGIAVRRCRRDQRIRCLAPSFCRRGPLDRCFSHSRSWQFDLESVGRPRISFLWRVLDHASSTGCSVVDFSAGITFSG
jgi:hypothetical protein